MNRISIATFVAAGFLAVVQPLVPSTASADVEVEWTLKKQLDLEATPLDVSVSADGSMIFILAPGKILVYSVSDDEIINRIPVEQTFDRLTYSARDSSLILSSRREKALRIIRLETVYDISTAGLPFQGPEDAPVTIAVFSDYQ